MLNSLQNLRALAAYSVVVYHCLLRYLQPATNLEASFLDLPSGGVDLFFVISGFIMVHTTPEHETPDWFMIKRIARIVPLYWAATLVALVLAALHPGIMGATNLSPASIASAFTFIPHPDRVGGMWPILGVGWSLNFEMLFYVLFAISLMLPSATRLWALIGAMMAIWLAATFGTGFIARFYSQPILLEFAAGALLAHLIKQEAVANFIRRNRMWPFALAGLAAFVLLVTAVPYHTASVFRYGIPACLLVFAAAGQDLYRTPARETVVTQLGDAGYSAYLFHPILIAMVDSFMRRHFGEAPEMGLVLAAIILPLTAVLSIYSCRWFEKPAARFLRNLSHRAPAAAGH